MVGKRLTPAQREFAAIVRQVKRNRERFIKRLERNLRREGECRIWTGNVRKNGYGFMNMRLAGEHFKIEVHRLFVILRLGAPIPEGQETGHFECHNPLCVKHVWLETRKENLRVRDGRQKAKNRASVGL